MAPLPVFDAVIHAPARLQICALLSGVDDAEFALIRDRIEVSDSVLFMHLKLLEEAGYVALSEAASKARQRTWVRLTRQGKAAFSPHVVELQRLAEFESLEWQGADAAPLRARPGRQQLATHS